MAYILYSLLSSRLGDPAPNLLDTPQIPYLSTEVSKSGTTLYNRVQTDRTEVRGSTVR